MCVFVWERERERERQNAKERERERESCLCELQHHHSSKILLTIDCRVRLRTYTKDFSWAMERGKDWVGHAWLHFLFSFCIHRSIIIHLSKIHREGKRRGERETGSGRRGGIWRDDMIKVVSEMNPVCPASSLCSLSSLFPHMNVHTRRVD